MSANGRKTAAAGDTVPRYPVRIGIVCCLAAMFFAGVVIPGMSEANNRKQARLTGGALRGFGVAIESYHLDYGIYPPGEVFAGDAVDAITVYVSEDSLLGPEFREVNTGLKFRPLDITFILALLVAWFVCLPEKRRLLPHAIQGLLCVAIVLVVASSEEYTGVLIMLLVGMLYSVSTVLSGRTGARRSNPRLPASERRLSAFILLAFVIFLSAWFIQKQHEAKSPVEGTRIPYRYVTDGHMEWMLQGTGWDRAYDLDLKRWSKDAPDETEKERWLRFIEEARTGKHTYDPSNGTMSGGDIFWFADRESSP